jgi:hypothetical protein
MQKQKRGGGSGGIVWGCLADPIDIVQLGALWPRFALDTFTDNEFGSELVAEGAPSWTVRVIFAEHSTHQLCGSVVELALGHASAVGVNAFSDLFAPPRRPASGTNTARRTQDDPSDVDEIDDNQNDDATPDQPEQPEQKRTAAQALARLTGESAYDFAPEIFIRHSIVGFCYVSVFFRSSASSKAVAMASKSTQLAAAGT